MSLDAFHQLGQTVGANLRAARLARKYTQNQLAQPDFSVSYISAIERGQIQPSLRALEILAQRLELSSTDLLPALGQLISEKQQAGQTAMVGEERDLLLLEAEVALHQGKPALAIELLHPLLAGRGEQHVDTMVRYLLGWAYLDCGSMQESKHLLEEAARQARETADPLYPCILSLQLALSTGLHNTEQALQAQDESVTWLEQPSAPGSNPFFLAHLSASLGQHYSHLGQLPQAQAMFQQSLATLAAQTPQLSTNWDLACLYSGQAAYQLATLYSYRCLLVDCQSQLPRLRSEIQHALGHVLRKSKPDEVYAHVLGVFQEARARQDLLTQASAGVHLAACLLARGELARAEQYVREAQKLAAAFGETMIGADGLLLQGELAYRQQEYTIGDRYFESGLAMLEQLGAEEELVEHLARYARLLEERGLIHKAIIYWKRAYENRQKDWTVSL
jgi:transcriptional regulator with XRE-family HTH domain